MKEKCKHENEHRSHWTLNDAAGDGWLTQLWYQCSECFEEAYIELNIAKKVIKFHNGGGKE